MWRKAERKIGDFFSKKLDAYAFIIWNLFKD